MKEAFFETGAKEDGIELRKEEYIHVFRHYLVNFLPFPYKFIILSISLMRFSGTKEILLYLPPQIISHNQAISY